MGVIAFEVEILVLEIENGSHLRVELEAWQRAGLTLQLKSGLIEMIEIQMGVAESVNKLARFESTDLSHHSGQKSVGGDIEGNSEKDVRTALVELT